MDKGMSGLPHRICLSTPVFERPEDWVFGLAARILGIGRGHFFIVHLVHIQNNAQASEVESNKVQRNHLI